METVDNRTFKQKVKDFGVKAQDKAEKAWNGVKEFCEDHPFEAIGLASVAIPGILRLGNSIVRGSIEKREDKRRELDEYDPRTGEHWFLRSKLSTNQKLELERRYRNGEPKGEILRSMRKL